MDSATASLLAGKPRSAGRDVEPSGSKGETSMNARIEARVTHHFKAAPERVFDAWLDPDRVRIWMATALQSLGLAADIRRVEIDARIGGRFFFSDMRDGQEAKHWGSYLELDRPRKIVFTWIVDESEEANPSTVSLTIEPDNDGCVATIVHEMDAKWSDYVARTENGWARMLEAVDSRLPDATP
jgi:uncharacterized protein YndB with AHSA1/START domain